ncbi:MAG: M14 family zinc carboxypeptidase [Candidatus Heimdallarchaeaceae archaeon]
MKLRQLSKTVAVLLFMTALVNLQYLVAISSSSEGSSFWKFQPKQQDDYQWIWDEFANAPHQIVGEDVVYWGENLGPYHNYTELTAKLMALNESFPEYVDVFSIGHTWENRTIWAVRITDESVTTAKTEFYIVAAHHAREIITVENALYFIDKLIYDTLFSSAYQTLLTKEEIYVIPMLNPDGVSVLHWFPEQRKNMSPIDDDGDGTRIDEHEVTYYWDLQSNTSAIDEKDLDGDGSTGEDRPGGVDLNRNYAAFWNGSGSSCNAQDDCFRGPYPFSEPETQAMRDFMYEHSFNLAVSLHSGIQAIITPWGNNNSLPMKDHDEFAALINALKNITGFPDWEEIGGYITSGEWSDYSYLFHDILGFTLETYGGIWNGNYFDYFNPPGNKILSNCEKIFAALIYLAQEPRLTYNNTLPFVEVTNPSIENLVTENYTIHWSATDADNDPLNISLFVSTDGLRWKTIAANLTAVDSYNWNLSVVQPGSYYIKVAVYDGKDWIHDVTEIKLNVKIKITVSLLSRILIWASAGAFGVIALLYYAYNMKKAKEISKIWGKEGN